MKTLALAAVVVLLLSACSNDGAPQDRVATAPSSASSALAAASSVAASTSAPSASAADATHIARYDGYGDMRLGMDQVAFDHAWGGKLVDTTAAPGSSCFYRRPQWVKLSRDFSFMFEGGHFVRYDVGTAKESAPGGGKVGMSVAEIHALYGAQVEEQPHKYESGAKYLRVKSAHADGVLLFETDADGKVTRWRVGVPPQVDYVEGCA